ncbi:MAG: low molecular weight phosphotyrosine protein phosphatase [Gammaproteobacteria bacterium]|nr:MAG: low molecular weight phosphotyrosine protein phosphatase [Gammaproteobacteria bacterium]
MKFERILVVCIGNICRSPAAEAMLRHRLSPDHEVSSAGIAALVDHAAFAPIVELMRQRGLDLSGHRARQLTREMTARSDLILVMEKKHVNEIHALAPESRGRVYRLGHWLDQEIPDPYRKSPEYCERILDLIEESVASWQERLE